MPFTRMDRATQADWDAVLAAGRADRGRVAESMLAMLRSLEGRTDGHAVDQLTHALQTATRAERAGADGEVVVAALLHDVARYHAGHNHGAVAGEMLRGFVRGDVSWAVRVHQDFTMKWEAPFMGGNPDLRRRHRLHPGYALAVRLSDEWDQRSFDPDYPSEDLAHFEPLVREVFDRPRHPLHERRVRRAVAPLLAPLRPLRRELVVRRRRAVDQEVRAAATSAATATADPADRTAARAFGPICPLPPIAPTEPVDPMEKMEPELPIDRMDPALPTENRDAAEATEANEPALATDSAEPAENHDSTE